MFSHIHSFVLFLKIFGSSIVCSKWLLKMLQKIHRIPHNRLSLVRRPPWLYASVKNKKNITSTQNTKMMTLILYFTPLNIEVLLLKVAFFTKCWYICHFLKHMNLFIFLNFLIFMIFKAALTNVGDKWKKKSHFIRLYQT